MIIYNNNNNNVNQRDNLYKYNPVIKADFNIKKTVKKSGYLQKLKFNKPISSANYNFLKSLGLQLKK